MQPDSMNTAVERTSKEYPTHSVIARVFAHVAERNSILLHRFCRGTLRILERQQMLVPQTRAMTRSNLQGWKLRGSMLHLQGTTMRGLGYISD